MRSIRNDQFKVLSITSLTEFGERYSYYFLQSLLILFLIYHFKLSQSKSAELIGTVLSMVYISAIVSGFIADRWLGFYRAAFVGACLMTIGSSILSFAKTIEMLYVGLGFIAMSSGLIKANMSSFIGRYYDKSKLPDSQRDFGFSLFYVGINLGAFFSQFLSAFLAHKYGYNPAFYSSIAVNVFMIGVLIFGFFKLDKYIADRSLTFRDISFSGITIAAYIAAVIVILHYPFVANLSIVLAIILCGAIIIYSMQASGSIYKPLAAGVFFLLSILYWSLFFQIFITLELFIKNVVTHNVFGIHLNTTQFLSIESFCVLLFGYFIGKLWVKLDKKGKEVHDIDKFNLAFILILAAFAIIFLGIKMSHGEHKVHGICFVIGFAITAISDLSLSAIGLSLITKIAPKKFVALYMGIWLVTLGVGGKLAGIIGHNVSLTGTIANSKASMQHGLTNFMLIAAAGSVLCFIFRKAIIKHTS